MKTIKQGVLAAAIALQVALPIQAFAIEGLKISVHCPDVWLSWPSVENVETYTVQYRQTLNTNTPWMTLTNFMPADSGTNYTTFVHSNQVQCPPGQTFGMYTTASTSGQTSPVLVPCEVTTIMAVPKSGGGDPVPLDLYPPGIDISTLNIFDATTIIWRPYTPESDPPSVGTADGPSGDDPDPPDPGPQGSDAGSGFYRVVRNGVWLFGLTNGTTLSGIVGLPIEAGYDGGVLHSVTISANGTTIEGTSMLSQPFATPLNFTLDTRRLINGDYYLQAKGMWFLPLTNEFETAEFELASPSVLVTVSNQISYPEWVNEFRDNFLRFKIVSATAGVDWRIDVYGQTGGYIGAFTNYSADGVIDFSWDLVANGVTNTDSSLTTVTTVTASGAPSVTQTNPPLIKVVDNYPDQGLWIVARASYIPTTAGNYSLYTNTVNGFAEMGESGGGVLPGEPYRHSGQAMVLSRATGATNWGAMYSVLLNHHEVRNFYFDGHGGSDWIGYGYDTDGNPTRTFGASQVAGALGNEPPTTNDTRFRWVFIDACDTAQGSWPTAFGMGTRENVPKTDYASRPSAYCGFDAPVYAWTDIHGMSGTIDIKRINYRGDFILYWWLFGDRLDGAFEEAKIASEDYDTASHLKIYGYWGLHWDELNTKGEWPP